MKCVAVLAPADKVSAKDNITKVFLMMSFSKIEKRRGRIFMSIMPLPH